MKTMNSVMNIVMLIVSAVMGLTLAVADFETAANSGASIVLALLVVASMGVFLKSCDNL